MATLIDKAKSLKDSVSFEVRAQAYKALWNSTHDDWADISSTHARLTLKLSDLDDALLEVVKKITPYKNARAKLKQEAQRALRDANVLKSDQTIRIAIKKTLRDLDKFEKQVTKEVQVAIKRANIGMDKLIKKAKKIDLKVKPTAAQIANMKNAVNTVTHVVKSGTDVVASVAKFTGRTIVTLAKITPELGALILNPTSKTKKLSLGFAVLGAQLSTGFDAFSTVAGLGLRQAGRNVKYTSKKIVNGKPVYTYD